jgi:hypothetical protein
LCLTFNIKNQYHIPGSISKSKKRQKSLEPTAYARLKPGQRTTKGCHTAVDQLITLKTWAVLGVCCKIVHYSGKTVKLLKNKLK